MKTFALATAAALFAAGTAFAQKAPEPQTGNLDASTETQIEQTEGATKSGDMKLPSVDLGATTQSTSGAAKGSEEGVPEFKDPGNLDASTKDNLQGR